MIEIFITATITICLGLMGLVYKSIREKLEVIETKIDLHIKECAQLPNVLILEKLDQLDDRAEKHHIEYREDVKGMLIQVKELQAKTTQHTIDINALLDRE